MADPALSPTLKRMLSDLNRRLDKIERSASLPWSSLRGGALKFQDTGGEDRWVMGTLRLDALTGEAEFDEQTGYGVFGFGDESLAFWLQEGYRGMVYPLQEVNFHSPAPVDAGSGVFITAFESSIRFPQADVLVLSGSVNVDAGTTGELKVIDDTSNTETGTLTVGAGGHSYEFQWLHPATSGLYDGRAGRATSMFCGLRARVASGGGQVHVFPPRVQRIASSAWYPDAADDGNPQLD